MTSYKVNVGLFKKFQADPGYFMIYGNRVKMTSYKVKIDHREAGVWDCLYSYRDNFIHEQFGDVIIATFPKGPALWDNGWIVLEKTNE